MDKKVVFFHFSKAITPTKTTSKRECALGVITARRRMRYSKWAVHSVTVTKFDLIVRRLAILIVATVAEVMCAKAMPQGNRAAVHALPVDLLFAMLFAVLLTGTVSFHLAGFAAQILFFCVFFDAKLQLAVDHATEVRFLTVIALVKSASMHCELK